MAKRFRRIALIAGVLVVAGGGTAVWASSGSTAGGYRTATVGPGVVTATLDETGTIQPISRATVSFPGSGQVSAVPVQVGQQVHAGQTLAQLDTTTLEGQLASAQSALATAQARLAADQSGQGSAATSGGGGRVAPALYVAAAPAPPDLKTQQDAVTAAQHQVDLDLTAASAAISAQQKACQPIVQPATDTTTTTTNPPTQNQVDSCTTAIQQAQDAQHTTATDEQKLADAEKALSATLAKLSSTPSGGGTAPKTPQPPGSSPKTAPGGSGSSGGGASKSQSGGSSATKVISAEQLAADQAAIDAADAQVAVAQQNLAASTLVSPIDGTVAQIGFTVGQNAGQQHIVVIGPGANQVTTAVSDTAAGQIKPGQQASVTPDGSATPITGQVTSIGLLSTTTSSGSPSYPVTISLPDSAPALFPGATASVSIIIGTTNASVTVPTSALHLLGQAATVTVLTGDKTEVRRVTVGVLGAAVAEVRSGLAKGDQVVLADLSQPLPTSNTNARGLVGGGGGGGPQRGGAPGGAGGGGR
ncbi:efflux RND transporter periplasmic adaptor subunit [Amycolatopsis pigmentata]|uniref:Efflux RND transporter periplasmic adaptor subunit n=1 Tax=Amycolatopsis pigmentata TaxID=450801 RepID=A0ABW5G2K6_9PSEU